MTIGAAPLAVFGYAFAHRKTQNFLFELAAAGRREVTLLAAPWQQLAHRDDVSYFPARLSGAASLPPREVCRALGFRYCEVAHDDVEAIGRQCEEAGFELAIIAGARILKRSVIDLFANGVVNFHPGKLPETAGLDAFFYTITRRLPLGVTAHFIDHRIDAGQHLFFEKTPIGPDDEIDVVLYNHHQSQLRALRRFNDLYAAGALERSPIDRPARNMPMGPEQKRTAVSEFPVWRAMQYCDGQGCHLLEACRRGDRAEAACVLSALPQLIEYRSEEGWTPLIVAAFNGHGGLVDDLLRRGANPNVTGGKGTTVLMYAKTSVLGLPTADYRILKALIAAGADLSRRDMHGRDIFDYVVEAGDDRLLAWLRGKGERK